MNSKISALLFTIEPIQPGKKADNHVKYRNYHSFYDTLEVDVSEASMEMLSGFSCDQAVQCDSFDDPPEIRKNYSRAQKIFSCTKIAPRTKHLP